MFEGDKIQLWKGSNDSDTLIFSQNIDYSQNINEDINCNDDNEDKEDDMTAIKCDCIDRLIMSLKYFDDLNISNESKNNDTFIKFIKEIYGGKNLLNDWIHFLSIHSNQIDDILEYYSLLDDDNNSKRCKISDCKLTARHYRNNRREEIKSIPTSTSLEKDPNIDDINDDAQFIFFSRY